MGYIQVCSGHDPLPGEQFPYAVGQPLHLQAKVWLLHCAGSPTIACGTQEPWLDLGDSWAEFWVLLQVSALPSICRSHPSAPVTLPAALAFAVVLQAQSGDLPCASRTCIPPCREHSGAKSFSPGQVQPQTCRESRGARYGPAAEPAFVRRISSFALKPGGDAPGQLHRASGALQERVRAGSHLSLGPLNLSQGCTVNSGSSAAQPGSPFPFSSLGKRPHRSLPGPRVSAALFCSSRFGQLGQVERES